MKGHHPKKDPAFVIRIKNREVGVFTDQPLDRKATRALSKELLDHVRRVEAEEPAPTRYVPLLAKSTRRRRT